MKTPTLVYRVLCAVGLVRFAFAAVFGEDVHLIFDFGAVKAAAEHIRVDPTTVYTPEVGYGFDFDSKVESVSESAAGARKSDASSRPSGCRSDRPFFFSVKLPEGNYHVKVVLGDATQATTTTVKAESRRLMLERVRAAAGEYVTRDFTVNVRTPRIETVPDDVKLKPRERGPPLSLDWDDKLTLEFSGDCPCVQSVETTSVKQETTSVTHQTTIVKQRFSEVLGAIPGASSDREITPIQDVTTVYLLGDSTVTDQPAEPWNSWGQMLPRFFQPGVAIANHAESGESLRSFLNARRLEKVLSVLKPGDYAFIQFGHNDQKERGEGVGAFTTYKASLKHYLTEVRKRGATPVLVTPVNRRTFDAMGKITNSLGDFPEAVRQTAEEEHAPLIDLNAFSKSFYEGLGPEDSKKAFVDNTHHNDYGSYELARCVVEGIRAAKLPLANLLAGDVVPFDPAHPDPIEAFKLPADPQTRTAKPEGN